MLLESMTLSLSRLRANLLRTVLTILGIVIGIAAVVALVSLGTAVEGSIDETFGDLGADTLTVQAGGSGVPSPPSPGDEPGQNLVAAPAEEVDPITAVDLEAVAATTSVRAVAPVVRDTVDVSVGDGSTPLPLIATTDVLDDTDALTASAGGFLSPLAVEQQLPVVVLGDGAAEELDLDASAIGNTIELDGRDYAVVGILEPVGGISFVNPDGAVIVPLGVAEGSLVDRDPDIDQLRVAATPDGVDDLALDVETALLASRAIEAGEELDLTVIEATAIVEVAEDTTGLLTTLTTSIGAIALVVGAIGIANMMLVAVRERTREIGIRRAVGATRRDITTQFLAESVVLSVLGGVIGTALGVLLSVVLAESLLGITAAVSTFAIGIALATSGVVGVVAGIGPAWQAASVDPTTALRYE